jgi:hypothetical protein
MKKSISLAAVAPFITGAATIEAQNTVGELCAPMTIPTNDHKLIVHLC